LRLADRFVAEPAFITTQAFVMMPQSFSVTAHSFSAIAHSFL
jgi:hypothetical protein